MSPRRAAYLVARREVRERLRSKAFRVSTAVTLLVIVAVVVLSSVVGGGGRTTYDVAVLGGDARSIADVAAAQARGLDARIDVHTVPDEAMARQQVRDGDVDAAILGGTLFAHDASSTITGIIQGANRVVQGEEALRTAGVPESQIDAVLDPAALPVRTVGSAEQSGAKAVAFIGVLLLYLAILTFGYALAGGVVEEKSSRVVEVVLATIRPRALLTGKVVGIGLVGAIQVGLVVLVGAGLALALGTVDLPDTTLGTALLVGLYFVLGYAFYAWAFAVVGSMVSRSEDVQSVSSPLMLLIVGGYLLSFTVVGNAGGTLATVCALVPPIAPMTVPAIAAQGQLSTGLLLGSIAILLVSTFVLSRLAARIYEGAVLRTGAPLTWRDVARLARVG
jgi:ABC-2 type transport system permease protein